MAGKPARERAARLYSLTVSDKRHALEPCAHLRALFERLPSPHPADRLHELVAVTWAETSYLAETPPSSAPR